MPTRRRAALAFADVPSAVDDARRVLLADWCRLVGRRLTGAAGVVEPAGPETAVPGQAAPSLPDAVAALALPPRVRQTLTRLLAGRSEKQVARDLGLSPHTVHTYVKELHKRLNVSSRGELLARFVISGEPADSPDQGN